MKRLPKMFIYALMCCACACPPVPVPPPSPDPDASIDDPDAAASSTCAAWCKHAAALHCDAAKPTRAGASCADVCVNVQTGPAKLNLRCRIAAKTCAAADVCEN